MPRQPSRPTLACLVLLTAVPLACTPPAQQTDAPPAGHVGESADDWAAEGWPAKTLPEIAAALREGEVSSVELVEAYLDRIERVDRAGPTLQSILALNPRALAEAQALDARRDAGEPLGPLHGLPILLKDNIESLDPVATTAGALALRDNVTGRDAPLVAGLRAAGAVILGKTNLSQWANFRSNSSISGWSALGGQVRNPHMLDRSPCGSSSGSGAAVAASLAAGAVGTETNGSIICPSNVNGIVGFKPTVGLVSQQYIVPISPTQDTAGPMSKTVTGAAMMLTAMATGEAATDFVAALDAEALQGAKVGVLRFAEGSNGDIQALFNDALKVLERAGASLVEIDSFEPKADDYWGAEGRVLRYEFKASLNAYLAEAADAVPVDDLEALIAFNEGQAAVELALFDQSIFEEANALGDLSSSEYRAALQAILQSSREHGIDALLAEHDVDILVSPSGPVSSRVDPINGDVWPNWVGAGYLAAMAGYPHVSVPMGHVHGVPIGLSFIGTENTDARVLAFGYAYEQRSRLRPEPEYLRDAESRPEVAQATAPSGGV